MTTLRVIAAVLVLTSCAGQSGDVTQPAPTTPTSGSPSSSSPTSGSSGELTITVRATPEGPAQTWTLSCNPPGGDHPQPEAACAALENAPRDPFAPVPQGMMCTQVYGGPETATITGTWRGEVVNASYKRTDGCEISRWNAIADVLGPGGV